MEKVKFVRSDRTVCLIDEAIATAIAEHLGYVQWGEYMVPRCDLAAFVRGERLIDCE